ncbi:hypothetical protein LSUB1_G007186 [Lachnellula subtilissima]|uniref:Uncharacterized protein n=1 Tax=Lachnellula subtilissima TaxID=602034 RepID=A0A8H8U6K6_9HELO|nr:hypothetical protein LSUB1_G007186 [Lachnellula subtilissima]
MASLRVSRAVPGLFRAARPSVVRSQLSRQIARRTYASGGHGPAKSSGDVVCCTNYQHYVIRAATSIAVTVPTLWYLLKNGPDTSHGHDDHSDAHGTKHEEEDSEEKSDEGEDKADDKESEKSEESESDSEDKGADTPDTSDDEGEGEAEDTSDDKNTRKSVPDAKGGSKARLESNKSIKQGEGDPEDEGATSGPAGSQNTQSGKQEGLSNTDTKHSTDITNNPDKSHKGEGVPETAKTKGAVDPNRPQV